MTRKLVQAIAVSVGLLAIPLSASAAGGLDRGFGNGGKVVTEVGDLSIAYSVAVQQDGKPVVGGFALGRPLSGSAPTWLVARYTLDGHLDPTFDGDGIVTTRFPAATSSIVRGIVIQRDGKIVVAGQATGRSGGDFALARYNADGSLDTAFGSGGVVLTDFGSAGMPTDDEAEAIAPTADEHLVVAGSTSPLDPAAEENFALARYDREGKLDASFGDAGRTVTDFGADDRAHGLTLLRDGSVVAAGAKGELTNSPQVALARYDPGGRLDSSFGGGKRLLGPGIAVDLLEQADGKLLVAGGAIAGEFGPSRPFLRRYDARGVLDATYGVGGSVVVDTFAEYAFGALALDRAERAVIVGTAAPSGGFLLARFTKSGDADAGLGRSGLVTTDFGGGSAGLAVAVGGDGKIVAAGVAWTIQSSREWIVLARYLPTYCVVPSVRGKRLPDAKRAIARAHCTVGTIRRAYSRTAGKDRVIAQSPAAGSRLAESSRVNVTASRGRRR